MSLLNELKECLLKIDEHVCYGKCSDNYVMEHGWDVIVFNRRSIRKKNYDIIDTYEVSICRESNIDEDLPIKVIKAIEEDTRLKLDDSEMPFNYIKKDDTDDVIEILTLTFIKARKNAFCKI